MLQQRLAPGMCKSPLCELSDPVSYALDFDFDSGRCSNLQAPIARKVRLSCWPYRLQGDDDFPGGLVSPDS